MEELRFSNEALTGLIASGILMMILAAALFIFLKIKLRLRLKPVIVGAIVFPLFAIGLKAIVAYPLLAAENEVSRAINSNMWLYYLCGGLMAGVFEETGRFLAYKTVLGKNTERLTAIGYGIGHGGFECIYIGFNMIYIAAMGMMINSVGLSEITNGLSEAQIQTAVDQLTGYAQTTYGSAALGLLERASALSLQIGMSVFVFAAARDKKLTMLYPLAILLHAAIDFMLVFYGIGYVSLAVIEIVFAALCLLLLFAALRLYRRLPADTGETEGV